jgi:hypothetical protein
LCSANSSTFNASQQSPLDILVRFACRCEPQCSHICQCVSLYYSPSVRMLSRFCTHTGRESSIGVTASPLARQIEQGSCKERRICLLQSVKTVFRSRKPIIRPWDP